MNQTNSTGYQDKLLWDQERTRIKMSQQRIKQIVAIKEIIMIDTSSSDEEDTINDVTKDLMLSCDTEDVTSDDVHHV